MTFRSGLPRLHSSIYLLPLWLSTLKRPLRFGRGRKAGTRATPPKKWGVMRSQKEVLCGTLFSARTRVSPVIP